VRITNLKFIEARKDGMILSNVLLGEPMSKQIEEIKGSGTVVLHSGHDEYVGYSNVSRFFINKEELIMQFGIKDPQNPDSAKGTARIYLSLSHAKRTAVVLARLIQQFEKLHGEIEDPSEDESDAPLESQPAALDLPE
jgi:hypothetical protein